ncbi:MAG: ATP-binding protein [Planctomycetes bacterium]|nr:ATP-binding protein [Planctomycetota bacterium]
MPDEDVTPFKWGFYGREPEIRELRDRIDRRRWFFLRITGRRRIGKTSLVREALERSGAARVVYIQIPDSDPAGVVAAARDFLEMFGVRDELPHDLRSLATTIGRLAEQGYVVALDEFQYFARKALYPFTSQLQAEVDRLSARASQVTGGLIVLGSIHTEMTALLDEQSAPLYHRVTDKIELDHLDIASLLELLDAHADREPHRLLFLWNLFEGVPKFYRDCWEQRALAADRRALLQRMFFSSSSPLRTEADHWFLGELRGRYDLVLKYISRHPGCSNGEVLNHVRQVEPEREQQLAGYLKVLDEKYRMVERLQPIFAKPTSRSGRFYVRDNFLRSWLAALSTAAASTHFLPLAKLLDQADERLAAAEGHGLERLAATLYEERSRKGLGDFPLTQRVRGFWDRGDTEIDLVALDEESRVVRLGTCKRAPAKLIADLPRQEGHVARFLADQPRFADWRIEKVAIAPRLAPADRAAIEAAGFIPQDLVDLTEGLR